jgi:hypothetical protein
MRGAQMAQAALAAGEEQAAVDACEIFIDLIEAPAPVMGPLLPELVRWAMSVTTNAQLELPTREMALQARSSPPPPPLLSLPFSHPVMCQAFRTSSISGSHGMVLWAGLPGMSHNGMVRWLACWQKHERCSGAFRFDIGDAR